MTDTTAPLDLDRIEARANAASAGPWEVMAPRPDGRNAVQRTGYGLYGEEIHEFLLFDTNPADAEFIAHARQDVPALIAEVKRLQPRTITSVEELDAVPFGTVVRTASGLLFEKYPAGWAAPSDDFRDSAWVMRGETTLTVIYAPPAKRT